MECHSVWTLVGCRVLLLTFRLKRAREPVIRRQAPGHSVILWSYIEPTSYRHSRSDFGRECSPYQTPLGDLHFLIFTGIRTKLGLVAAKLDSKGRVRNGSAFFCSHFEA